MRRPAIPRWKARLWMTRRAAIQRLILQQGGGCASCGVVLETGVYDIDHALEDGSEDRKQRSREQIYAGISGIYCKGRIFFALCLNCHRMKTLHPVEFVADRHRKARHLFDRLGAVASWIDADLDQVRNGDARELPGERFFEIWKCCREAGTTDPWRVAMAMTSIPITEVAWAFVARRLAA